MRIRKHAKISQLLESPLYDGAVPVLQTYICQLNQSPWDAMSFSPPPPLPPPQVDAADANSAGGGNGGSDPRVLVGESENLLNGNENHVNEFLGDAAAAAAAAADDKEQCCKTDGKSWRCRREAAAGSSLCDHHLSLVKNYQNLAHNNTTKKSQKSVENRRSSSRSRWRIESPSPVSSHEFYYYSGFRPGWSKKRSQTSNNNNAAGSGSNHEMHRAVGASSSRIQNIEGVINSEEEYEEDDEDEDEEHYVDEGAVAGKMKRARKPIKARSLKSLM